MDPVPVIDISGRGVEASARIGAACREVGFFYIAGHGVDPALVARAFAASAAFFALDAVAKSRVLVSRSPHNRGYVPMLGEALNPAAAPDLKEAFNIGLDLPATDPEVVAGKPFRGINLWPELPGFRDTMLDYFAAMQRLSGDLHRAFAIDLGLPADYFASKIDRPMSTLRLLHYPARPPKPAPGQMGAGEHTDYGNVTILATDSAGGLEVRLRSGAWIAAPVVPGAFVCNIGDCLMRWSNDNYLSTPHRVVNPAGRQRSSIAFFCDPNPDAMVECLPSCATPQRPARYAPVTGADFLRSRLLPTYAHGTANG